MPNRPPLPLPHVRKPLRRSTRHTPWWADCQAAMDAAVACSTAGYRVLVCAATPAPRVLIMEGTV